MSIKLIRSATLALGAISLALAAQAETIRLAIGTQDTTINCATGGLLIRELKLLDKYLPHDGKYKGVTYDVQWKNFTSGAPLTNEMLADKLDIGSMAEFPGAANGAAFQKAGKKSVFVTVLSGSTLGSGNGIVVPKDSPVTSLSELRGKTISVPFASAAHGMLLRALKAQGLDPAKDVNIISQAPEVAGPALQADKIDAHADFVPFAEAFPYRGYARKIYDGAQSRTPTFHGTLINSDFGRKYPEVVIAFLRASIEADRIMASDPEKYSELIEKVTGIEAPVSYLFHGPLGLQTREHAFLPAYRQALQTAIDTLRLLRRTDTTLDAGALIDDSYIRAAYRQSGLNYDAALKASGAEVFKGRDAVTGKPITDTRHLAGIWVKGEAKVRHYASVNEAVGDLARLEKSGKTARALYVHDLIHHIKLLGSLAWYTVDAKGDVSAFLQKDAAVAYAAANKGRVVDFNGLRQSLAGK
ncbi:ABC transporter substrate-binding protein [Aquabacterium sp.]|uniref:ABC transporter substrate-binding protein n=1 Tax=Aquabacterium sp. TaxID=1872578 RepID=UPI0035B2BB2A